VEEPSGVQGRRDVLSVTGAATFCWRGMEELRRSRHGVDERTGGVAKSAEERAAWGRARRSGRCWEGGAGAAWGRS
jgi:hypothetical protein